MPSVAMMSLLLLAQLGAPTATPADTVLARRLRWAALDQQAELNFDSALVLLQRARRADPSYAPAHYAYMNLRFARYEDAVLRRESVSLARSADPGQRCVGIAIAGFIEHRSTDRELLAMERSGHTTTCSTFFLALEEPRRDYPDSLRLVFVARALRQTPEADRLWTALAASAAARGNPKEAERILEQGGRAVQHPLARMSMSVQQVTLRLSRGDTAAAIALRRSHQVALDRDRRPGLRWMFEETACFASTWGHLEDQDAKDREALQRPRAKGDWAALERTLLECGRNLIDRSENLKALQPLTRAIAIADSVRLPDLYLSLYALRGRAYLKLGRLTDAERDLRRALALGAGAGRAYSVADAHHNLAHMYEGLGRWRDANREIDRFVALARPMHWTVRFTSLLDAGEIRWKAGWHASSRAAFEEMVRLADESGANNSYAGQYFERIGDLQRARQYFEKARAEYGGNTRGQSGMARLYESLGLLDSAEAIAREHDAQESLWPPLEIPLMPAILAGQGRSAEAITTTRAFARRQEQRGNVHGASVAYLQLARLALESRAPNEALVAATHAESLATILLLANERIQAVTLRGRALQQLGSGDSAVTALRLAVQLANRDATTANLLETHLALGNALAGLGQRDAALAAYEHAARAVERVTGSLVEDLDRARYRDRHLLPFDGAVQTLVGGEFGAARNHQLFAWSARRKAAALALATRIVADSVAATTVRLMLADVQRRLGERDALLDYLVLDSGVAVLAVTRERASLIRLPVSRDSLAAMVAQLRHPLVTVYGGRLDLARAPYDLGIAAELHSVLVGPLAPVLVGKRRLIIVPDGPLHALSFEALVASAPARRVGAPDYAGTTYLIDTHEVEYLLSSSLLAPPNPERKVLAGSRLLVVSYGAPGAEQEASALRAAWRADGTLMLGGTAATERAAKASMSRFGVIHFVVHAQASARDPLTSHLRLAPDSIEDGYLNLDEIAAARLSARLVVLSACETDAGPILNGEGVMGLARAFLAGGAQVVIGTQWPIGPTMADLMGQFYRRLAAGDAPSPALRVAKLALRSRRETAHPFYWAAAVMVTGGGGQ